MDKYRYRNFNVALDSRLRGNDRPDTYVCHSRLDATLRSKPSLRSTSRESRKVAVLPANLTALWFGLIGLAGMALAAPLEYPCFTLANEPVIDGMIEDVEWANIPEAGGFYILKKNEYAVEKQTVFRMARTKDALYIAARCEEPNVSKLSAKEKDQGPLWNEDSVEIFFMPEGDSNTYVQVIISAAGSRWNQKWKADLENQRHDSDTWDWQAKSRVGKDYWSMEAKLPLALLWGDVKEGLTWRMNVARNMRNEPASERLTTWSPLKIGFHDWDLFNRMQFKGNPPAADEVRKIEQTLRQDYRASMRAKVRLVAGQYAQYKSDVEESCKQPRLRPDAETLRASWELLNKAAGDEAIDESVLRQAFQASSGLIDRTEYIQIRLLMEQLFADVK